MKAPHIFRAGLVAGVVLLLGAGSAHSNGATYSGSGSDVYPIENHQVSMRRELIRLTPSGAGWATEGVNFDCRFWFVNHGDSTTVSMGFPLFADQPDLAADAGVTSLCFRVEVDGAWVLPRGAREGTVFLWPVHFRGGEEREVRVRYYLPWSSEDMSLYPQSITYVLTTGALWRDPIERSDLVFECGPRTPVLAVASNLSPTRYDGRRLWWEFRDVRPRENLTVRFSENLANGYAGQFTQALDLRESPTGRATHELIELLDSEWEEQIESAIAETAAEATQPGDPYRPYVLRMRAEIADSAAAWRERLEGAARHGRSLTPIERMNLEYARAVEEACGGERPFPELLARIEDIHRRYW